ncbi:MAG: M20/M25/M40 family metallo-hydrolase [Candidatus Izemoplasmatales bacterium]
MNKTERIRNNAFSLAEDIINKTGPRLAGTSAAKEAASLLYKEVKFYTNESHIEEFYLHKGAFLGWIKILVICYILSLGFLWFNLPYLSLALSLISILVLVLQFFFYLPIIDIFYPKRKGYNVVGYIEPKKEIKKQVIISGHHDSARVFNFFIHQPALYNLRVTGAIIYVLIMVILSIISGIFKNPTLSISINIFLSLGLVLIIQMWFFASSKGTPGAGDNLIASTMAIELGRYFSENKLDHTRIIITSFDAEEEGLRGARAFAKANKEKLKEYPTILLNTDCAYSLKELFFLTSDINCTVNLDSKLANDLVDIAKNNGYNALAKPISFLTGGTDAGELAKIGVKATTLVGMPWSNQSRSSVYHTPNDTLDYVEKEIIDAAINIFGDYILFNDTK